MEIARLHDWFALLISYGHHGKGTVWNVTSSSADFIPVNIVGAEGPASRYSRKDMGDNFIFFPSQLLDIVYHVGSGETS